MKLEKARDGLMRALSALSEDLVNSYHLHGSSQPSVYNFSPRGSDTLRYQAYTCTEVCAGKIFINTK